MQFSYYRFLQSNFGKWKLLTKLRQEEEYQSKQRNGVMLSQGTEAKLLVLKSLISDRLQVRAKQAFSKWQVALSHARQREEAARHMQKMLVVQKLLARKGLHQKWTMKAQRKLCFHKWRQQCRAGYR